MIKQEIKFQDGQKITITIGSPKTLVEVNNVFHTKVTLYLDVKEMEELTDLMMDCFYKAQQVQNRIGQEVHNG